MTVLARFQVSREAHPDRPALDLGDHALTYGQLGAHADRLAAAIRARCGAGGTLAALLASRSLAAYVGVLGIMTSGRGYVPLHPRFPPARSRRMLEVSGADALVVGAEALETLQPLLEGAASGLTILGLDVEDFGGLPARFPGNAFVTSAEIAAEEGAPEGDGPQPGDLAYLLFTSGSTGDPKGVPVRHASVDAYVDYVGVRFGYNPEDRVSQAFDLTFDPSVHDMFVTWAHGACLCPVPEAKLMAPSRFIRDMRLTTWFSVPSIAVIMSELRMLKPGAFPNLRLSLFSGEALPERTAQQWAAAAPASRLVNLYGPTEATITTTEFDWSSAPAHEEDGVVPLGWSFPHQAAVVLDSADNEVPAGEPGELCLGGPQICEGYWRDEARTAARFFVRPDSPGRWYRTGDLVVARDDGCLLFRGRVDEQVKIRGNRIELMEVDGALRAAAGTDRAICVAWPIRDGLAKGIVAFVAAGSPVDEAAVLAGCRERLPAFMIPDRIVVVDELPLNVNGKTDRGALRHHLDEESAHAAPGGGSRG